MRRSSTHSGALPGRSDETSSRPQPTDRDTQQQGKGKTGAPSSTKKAPAASTKRSPRSGSSSRVESMHDRTTPSSTFNLYSPWGAWAGIVPSLPHRPYVWVTAAEREARQAAQAKAQEAADLEGCFDELAALGTSGGANARNKGGASGSSGDASVDSLVHKLAAVIAKGKKVSPAVVEAAVQRELPGIDLEGTRLLMRLKRDASHAYSHSHAAIPTHIFSRGRLALIQPSSPRARAL